MLLYLHFPIHETDEKLGFLNVSLGCTSKLNDQFSKKEILIFMQQLCVSLSAENIAPSLNKGKNWKMSLVIVMKCRQTLNGRLNAIYCPFWFYV